MEARNEVDRQLLGGGFFIKSPVRRPFNTQGSAASGKLPIIDPMMIKKYTGSEFVKIHQVKNKPGLAQVGAISKAQK